MKKCQECGATIENKNKFCNSSCSAKYNNKLGLTGRKKKKQHKNLETKCLNL